MEIRQKPFHKLITIEDMLRPNQFEGAYVLLELLQYLNLALMPITVTGASNTGKSWMVQALENSAYNRAITFKLNTTLVINMVHAEVLHGTLQVLSEYEATEMEHLVSGISSLLNDNGNVEPKNMSKAINIVGICLHRELFGKSSMVSKVSVPVHHPGTNNYEIQELMLFDPIDMQYYCSGSFPDWLLKEVKSKLPKEARPLFELFANKHWRGKHDARLRR